MLYSHRYELSDNHFVVPVLKYKLLVQKIKNDHQLRKLPIFQIKNDPKKEDLLMVHDLEYLNDFLEFIPTNEIAAAEIPLTFETQEFFLHSTAASREGLLMARESGGVFINLGGGFHHAFRNRAEGFCFLNDVNVAVEAELRRKPGKALILDLDVHQGNGIINFFAERDDVVVANIHQQDNYPVKEEAGINYGLPSGTTGKEYMQVMDKLFEDIKKKAGKGYDFAVYLAGADPYKDDRLGGFLLTIEELQERDQRVKKFFHTLKVPALIVLAGGYAYNIDDIVQIHIDTVKTFLF